MGSIATHSRAQTENDLLEGQRLERQFRREAKVSERQLKRRRRHERLEEEGASEEVLSDDRNLHSATSASQSGSESDGGEDGLSVPPARVGPLSLDVLSANLFGDVPVFPESIQAPQSKSGVRTESVLRVLV